MWNEDDMPVTRTDLFSLMLLNFLLTHIHQQKKHKVAMIKSLEKDLPPEIHQNLVKHCLLAYNLMSENKTVMSDYELGMSDETLTLGLLQITHSVTVFGPDVHYNFPHLSIQEFMAALHIQWMRDEDREASAIQGLMDNDPLNPVITFYAGLTKLKNKKVQDILMEVQKIKHSIVRTMMYTGISIDTRQKQMALLNSIYECQDTDLVKIYTPNVTKDRIPNPWSVILNISLLPLYPSDCLSLAYYARLKLRSMKKESKLNIILRLCSITDVGLETFSNELSKGIDEVTLGNITLTLTDNLIITDRANRSIRVYVGVMRHVNGLLYNSII